MTENKHSNSGAHNVQHFASPAAVGEGAIDLVEIWNVIWGGKWVVIGITALFAIAAVVVSLMLPNIYKSDALLAPVSGEQENMLASVAGKFGGLAGLTGMNLGGSYKVNPTILAMEILQSRSFVVEFVRKHDLAIPLVAATGWDAEAKKWNIDPEIYDTETGRWVRDVSPPRSAVPSDWELFEAFREVLSVQPDSKTYLVTLSVKLKSPEVARDWVVWLVEDINSHIREQEVQDAKKSIQYLQGQLNKTAVAEMQNIFYQLIEQETKRMMLAEVRSEYVFRIVDPPIVPERKSEPKRAQICILATLLGGFAGLGFVFFRHAMGQRRLVSAG